MLSKFDEIRAFTNTEAEEAFKTASNNFFMQKLIEYAYPSYSKKQMHELLCSLHSIDDFINAVPHKAINKIIETSCDGLSFSGNFEKTPRLFISNHRDIVLDSTILNKILEDKNMKTSYSAIGDNLVPNDDLKLIAKISRLFIVKRGLSLRETLLSSQLLSEYMSCIILEQKSSIWLAQREGRTKDGNDQTNTGVLKMLTMASKGSIVSYLKELNLTPMAVSYEYDPTAKLKIPSILAEENGVQYIKASDEDLKSIITGALGYKGRVNISISESLDKELDELNFIDRPTVQLRRLAEIIDEKIYKLYRLFPTNYVAYDILFDTKKFIDNYSSEEFLKFQKVALNGLEPHSKPWQLVLKMYANPVVNKYKLEPFN